MFSGIQPTGDLHLGNYLGALVNWVAMQDDRDCTYCIVDLHAVTVEYDPTALRQRTIEMATNLLAVGVDPQRATLFVQSHLGDVHGEATWLLNCVTGFGELRKQPQFKEKADRIEAGDLEGQVSVGLFDYPVLQTADIILYHAEEVPVGEDQRHHVELARNIAQRFNHRFCPEDAPLFTLPQAIHPAAAARVMDLQEPTNRMSKSASSPKGVVGLLDEPARLAKKIRSAVTDSGTDVRYDRQEKAGISNLLEVLSAATGREIADLEREYGDRGYGVFKSAVAEAVVELLRPVQERHAELAGDPGEVERILADGAARAREVSSVTLAEAKDAMGFWAG
ncbi:MAG: tryptophan--tRNA ligase [Actinobacteria bacterium]|nr:tryptophan--tRNA ligase [Actinomycetota bacterium]